MRKYKSHTKSFAFICVLSILLIFNPKTLLSSETEDPKITFSHPHGFYSSIFVLTLSSNLPGSKIRYTIDGSNPISSTTSKSVDSPHLIEINPYNTVGRDYSPGFIVRACVEVNNIVETRPITQSYMFIDKILELSPDNLKPGPGWLEEGMGHDISYGLDPDVYEDPNYSSKIEEAFLSIPTFSLVTDLSNLFDPDSGIYVNALFHGREWEREASVELLNPDSSEGFQVNCGIRIRGGWSRHYNNPKHAFRLIFREEYGSKKLNYPLFGDEGVSSFDNIDLRTSQNYSWSFYGDEKNTFMREVFSRDTQKDMGRPYTRSRFYHLYINGTYWGLFQTQERSEASFAESYFGGQSDDYDVIKVDVGDNFNLYNVEATDGTLEKWRQLWDYAELGFDNELFYKVQGLNTDGSINPDYEKLLDLDNLIDYMIITIFTGDFDGPVSAFGGNNKPNNFYAIINRVNPDGFKFFRHDGEHTLFEGGWGEDRTGPFPAGENFLDSNPQWIHQKLSENINYRLRFADRVYKHFYNHGALTLENNIDRILKRKAQIEFAIIAESARWGDSKTVEPKTKVHWENEINNILYNYLPTRNVVVLDQLINKGLFDITQPPQFNVNAGIVEKGTDIELSSPNGSIYYTTDGSDPLVGFNGESENPEVLLINEGTSKRVFIPKSQQSDDWLKNNDFDDSNWLLCENIPGGIGYDDKGIYTNDISLDVKNYMHESGSNPNSSCLIRIPFSINDSDILTSNIMTLKIKYDDGFVAYLNGEKVLQVNAPNDITWNSTSLEYIDNTGYENFDISNFVNLLKNGDNLLAIHGLNTSLQSSDFLMLPTLVVAKGSGMGLLSQSAKLYSEPINIVETTIIKTRMFHNNSWSVLNEQKFIIDEDLTNLKITELHYHPLDQIVEQDTINDREYEFLELKNVGSEPLNLTGSYFSNGIIFQFPAGSVLEPDSFYVLASNKDEFLRRYGFLPNYSYEGQLDNSGETIELKNAADQIVFSFRFNDKNPWPEIADGEGYSLVSKSISPMSGNPYNIDYWTHSQNIHGSPGIDDLISDLQSEIAAVNTFELLQNYPNPFNPETIIRYSLGKRSKVDLTIYDILGKKIINLVDEFQNSGSYNYTFNGDNLSSGIYFYRLKTGNYISTKRMILLK